MDLSILTLILSICTFAIVAYIFLKLRDQKTIESGKSENLENKIDSVSKDLNEIENQLASVTTPINELNRFLGGNVTTGRLGEWSLESIVKDIMPNNKYYFQHPIDPNTQNQVDCAIETTNEILIPIDSKFYAAQYSDYQEATTKTDRDRILNSLKNSIVKDAESISEKYFVNGITSKIGVLYIPSEGLVAMVNLIEGLRESLLRDQSILILGPNSLAGFLDSIRMGHEAVELNEKAELVAKVIGDIKEEFNNLNLSTIDLKKAVDGVSKKIDVYQTRINVLNKELNKGAEKLEESEIEN